MNKLVLEPEERHHIRFLPLKTREIPVDEADQIRLTESIYNNLVENGEILYQRTKQKSHSIYSVKLNNEYFIIVCIKNEFGTYNDTIYELSNENDCIALAKFTSKNIRTIMNDYKKQILDANKMHVERKEEENGIEEKIIENSSK